MKKITILFLAAILLVANNFNTKIKTEGANMKEEQLQTTSYFYNLEGKSEKIKNVTITHDQVTKYNLYIVTDKNGKVDVLSADTSKSEAPEKVKKVIEELKKAGYTKPQTRFFNLLIIWW